MAGSLIERLQLVVDATTGAAEARFQKLGAAADTTAKTAKASGEAVASAADRVAQSQLKAEQAAGAVRVAESRLQELRESGRAKTSQLTAAEERLASAQRTHHVAQRQLVAETGRYGEVQAQATAQLDRGAKSAGTMRGALGGLAAAGAAFGGLALGQSLRESVTGFVEGARGAALLGRSMNATTEQAGRLQGLANSLGLDFDDLVEIQAEFAQKVASSGGELTKLGVQVQRNADGTTNWATTLEDTLVALQGIPDATERNRVGFKFFGEEGFKQLSRLVSSGKSVREALEDIGTPFTDADVRAAQEYDAAMLELSLTGGKIERTLGRALVPVIADLASGFSTFLDVVTAIPAPIALTTAAALALGVSGFNPAAAAGARLSTVLATVNAELIPLRVAMLTGGAAAGTLGAGLGAAGAAGGGLLKLVGGPLGAGLLAGGALLAGYASGLETMKERAADAAGELDELAGTLGSMEAAIATQAMRLDDNAGYWERFSASIDAGIPLLTALGTSFGDMNQTVLAQKDNLEQARRELGEYGAQQSQAATTTRGLNNLIAEGTTSGQEFAQAVRDAAVAQAEEARTSGLAEAAIDAYRAVTDQAVQATLALVDAQVEQRGGLIDLQKEIHGAKDVVDDLATPWNEVEEATIAVIEQARNYSEQVADAAVASARANGQVVGALEESAIRADAVIGGLREALNQPGLTDEARAQIEQMIADLETAKTKGDIEAILRLTGAPEVAGELDATTEDRETTISVETRGGPAVQEYLNRIADTSRLARIQVESRGGPDVQAYLERITGEARLAIIRVESRNGPAVDSYLDSLTRERLAIIRVETRGGPAVDQYLDGLANQARNAVIGVSQREAPGPTGLMRGAPAGLMGGGLFGASSTSSVGVAGDVNYTINVAPGSGIGGRGNAELGREIVGHLRAYESRNGPLWRR